MRWVRGMALALLAGHALSFVLELRARSSESGGHPDVGHLLTLSLLAAAILAVYLLSVLRSTASPTAPNPVVLTLGALAAGVGTALWLAIAMLDGDAAGSPASAVLALTVAAALAAWFAARRSGRTDDTVLAALCAISGAGLLIAVLIDDVLPRLPGWVSTAAPPVYSDHPPVRLVDSVGIWLLGCLAAGVLWLLTRRSTTPSGRRQPAV